MANVIYVVIIVPHVQMLRLVLRVLNYSIYLTVLVLNLVTIIITDQMESVNLVTKHVSLVKMELPINVLYVHQDSSRAVLVVYQLAQKVHTLPMEFVFNAQMDVDNVHQIVLV